MAQSRRGVRPKRASVAPADRRAAQPDGAPAHNRFLAKAAAFVGAIAIATLAAGVMFQSAGPRNESPGQVMRRDAETASFVGSDACAGCHRAEAELWRGSQHQGAMAHADEKSVLGDFTGVTFEYFGVRSRFFRADGRFLVETDGPDGEPGVFEVKYTFGIDPLQQYLVEFPDGRLQALPLAWDSRPGEMGGQRWFHLYPGQAIRHDDVLHWTGLNQNWNFMCAECHSTGVRKNYDPANDRFRTSWTEISVGCEACHGQGSRHIAWAQSQQSWWPFGKSDDPVKGLAVRFERRSKDWSPDPKTGSPPRSMAVAALRKEVETCGLCHARRGALSEDWVPGQSLSNTHAIAPIRRGLYHADGQMLDEVYNYGSFKQSKMFAAGVTCSDCHEPHSAKLRLSGDSTCLQCHAPEKFAVAEHRHHEAAGTSVTCASCHMPARTYMVVDRRHDHGFRVPRPDLSVRFGVPNACNDCHTTKSPDWAAAAVEQWHGPIRKGSQTFAVAFHAAWADQADAATLLATVAAERDAPAFVRASALAELAPHIAPANIDLARKGLADPDPMVRIGALDMLASVPVDRAWAIASPRLADENRGVRIRAASLLAGVPTAGLSAADRERFEGAAAEFIAAQRLNADRPEARDALGTFLRRRGLFTDSEAEYRAALRLSPHYAVAAINLADLYRQLGRNSEGEIVLRAAVASAPSDAGVHHALGLTLVRLQRQGEALIELRHAADLAPERPRYAYVYAVGLHSAGRGSDAIAVVKESLARHPANRDLLLAAATFSRDAGDPEGALDYAERLLRLVPADRELKQFIEVLRRDVNRSGR